MAVIYCSITNYPQQNTLTTTHAPPRFPGSAAWVRRTGPSAQGRTRLLRGLRPGPGPHLDGGTHLACRSLLVVQLLYLLPATDSGQPASSAARETAGPWSGSARRAVSNAAGHSRWTAHPCHILQVRRPQVRPTPKERGPYKAVTTQKGDHGAI